MSHEMESMFSVSQTPWHGLGKIVTEAPDAAAAIKLAGLDWTVEERQIHLVYNQPDVQLQRIPTHKAIVRSTDQSVLGVVGSGYTPVQNSKAFDFFNPFVEAGECTFETAGSLMSGKRVWVLAKLNREPMRIAKDDEVAKYLMLSNGHDGTTSLRVGFTPIRIVCANTLAMAHNSGQSQLLRVSHRNGVNEALDKIKEVVNAADAKFNATAEQYKRMVKLPVKGKDLEKFVKFVFFSNKEETERRQLRMDVMNETIAHLFEHGQGNNTKAVRGTYWALYNAATEYLSYASGRSQDTRLTGLWFGGTQRTQNERAFEFAMAGGDL